jgi:hypothetical protein
MARELDLDLVEVAGQANPPVVKIMDFGKYKYEEAQRAKESRRKSTNISIKEMKYRPKIGQGDFDTKTRKVAEFLSEGHKVKITIMFRGREVFHPSSAPRSWTPSPSSGTGREGGDPRQARRPEHDDGPRSRQASAASRQRDPERDAVRAGTPVAAGAARRWPMRSRTRGGRRGRPSRPRMTPCQDEDLQDRGQAVPQDRHRQAPPRSSRCVSTCSRRSLDAHAAARRLRRVHSGDVKRIKRLLGER